MALIKHKGFAVRLPLQSVLFGILLLLPVTVSAAVCPNPPTLIFDSASKYVDRGGSVDYIVTVSNTDVGSCSFPLSTTGDTVDITSTIVEGSPLTVGAGASADITLRVSVASNVADWTSHVTTLDVDETTADATSTVNNRLLHNSVNVGSAKHGGKWGTPEAGSMYGAFTCQTCHVQDTNNIKRIRTSITTPDTTVTSVAIPTGTLPGDGQSIVFTNVVNNSADLGDDSDGHATSDRICEICHSYDATGSDGVRFHAYDMSAGGADLGHYNTEDCLQCHPHNAGFKASCASCHGGGTVGSVEANFWPDESSADTENDQIGRHLEHMDYLSLQEYGVTATVLLDDTNASSRQIALCAFCHDAPGADAKHLDGDVDYAFRPAWAVGDAASGTYTTADGNCTNICHNNKATGVDDEPGGTATWGWNDTATSTCLMCHNDITVTTGGTTGATHDRHLNLAADFGPALVCASCHHTDTDWAGTAPGDGLHINGTLNVVGSKVAGDEYTGSSIPGANFGSCSGGVAVNVCHSDGAGSAPARAYVWGSTLANDCASCHLSLPTSNAHDVHVQTADASYGSGTAWPARNTATTVAYDFSCVNCHGTTKNNHLDGDVDVPVGGYVGSPGTCASAACHTDGTTPTVYKTTPAWNANFVEGACDGCHGNFPTTAAHPQHTLEVGFHYDAIYSGFDDFLPVTDADSYDVGLDDGDGDFTNNNPAAPNFDQLRGHGNSDLETAGATAIVSCNTCHADVVTTKNNDLGTYYERDEATDDHTVQVVGEDKTITKACVECHTLDAPDGDQPTKTLKVGVLAVTDKALHVNGSKNVRFFDLKIRSKAQVRDENSYVIGVDPEPNWSKATELTNNWVRVNGYKAIDGSSYDEQPDTLHNMAVAYGGANYYDTGVKTCMVSCHLWEANRADRYPVHWVDNATDGSLPLMCIDCHTRLPK